jgi:peptidoglycan/LPS O-acetylase OafA/YrhL
MGPTLILLGAVLFVWDGAVVARANPSATNLWKLRLPVLVLPLTHWVLLFLGMFLGLVGAATWRHEIGLWSYMIYLLTVPLSLYVGQAFQRRRMSTQNGTDN